MDSAPKNEDTRARPPLASDAPRPVALPVRVEAIHAEFKARPWWLCWRYEQRRGKWTKPPFIAGTDDHASSTDPSTHRPFDVARRAYESGGYDGIGLALTDDDEYVGIDLDHCRNRETGEVNDFA